MGKDAANTLFAENQVLEQQTAPEQFKGVSGFHEKGILDEMNKGSGLEFRQPEGDKFHGDMLKPDVGTQYNSTPRPTQQFMQDSSAGGFHGDPLAGSQGEAHMSGQFRDSHLTNRMGDEFPKELNNDRMLGDQGGFKTTETMVLKPHSSSISSSLPSTQSGFKTETFDSLPTASFDDRGALSSGLHNQPDLHGTTQIHDGRHAGMLPDGRTINEPALHDRMQEDTLADTTIHDGRRSSASESDSLPLAERVVAGVHAGDPLSRKGKLSSLFKKDKHKGDEFQKDGVIKGDHDLIPHEHLKKSDDPLADEHLSGTDAILTRQQNNFEAREPLLDMHNQQKDVHILQPALQSALGPREHAVETFCANHPGLATSDTHGFHDSGKDLSKDSTHLSKDLDNSHLSKDSDSDLNEHGGKRGKLKDKLHRQKEKIKEKLHLRKDSSKRDEPEEGGHHGHTTEARAHPKGHEIATIKIPGIESGDRAAQEMVNHQAKAKKELNAELKEHAGHSDHLAPSEILGHGQTSLHENRAIDSPHLAVSDLGASDQITKDQVLAKSELNAEIKNHAGLTDHILPSEIAGNQFQGSQLDRSNQFQDLPQEFAGSTDDALMKDNILAKQAVNAEIKEHAGTGFGLHHLEILPTELSKDQFQREDLSQRHDQFHSKDFQKDDEFLSKDLQKDFQKSEFVPSGEKDDFEISEFQRLALHKSKALHKDQPAELHPSMAQNMKDKVANAAAAVKDTMGNMGSKISHMMPSSSAPVTEHAPMGVMDMKEDVNAEIRALGATHPDHIMPSDISTAAPAAGLASIPEKVTHAAAALRDTFGSKISHMMPSSSAPETVALEKKNVIIAKDEVNAEIRALGATHPDHIMPSDISTTAAAPAATGLASFIPEKVTHAAAALKDTLSNMMPSSAPATEHVSREVVPDLEQKDAILAKEEVNAEIKALGATSSDNIMPSDISTGMHTAPTATGLASFIPEKVTHAAAVLKDTLGSKISHMMPSSSSSAPATVDLEQKDAVLAKEEVNAEIKALGATSSDNIVPSDISTSIHTAPTATGLASFIPEKVTHAAAALKDTLGSKISGLLPSSSSHTVPASQEVVIADLMEQKDVVVAKNEINAEIKELGSGISGTIMPSEVAATSTAAAPTAGTTVIHDGRTEVPDITDGAGRLKSEVEYERAQDDSMLHANDSHLSMRQMIQEKVTNAAMAVKEKMHL
jgi:hypothetical protein